MTVQACSFPQWIQYQRLSNAPSPETVFLSLYRDRAPVVWLDSSDLRRGVSRFSLIADASHPSDYSIRYRSRTRTLEITGSHGEAEMRHQGIFDFLRTEISPSRAEPSDLPFPFRGGFVGYFGYELKGECEGRYRHDSALPDAYFLKICRFLAFDHESENCYVVAPGEDEAWIRETVGKLEDLASGRNRTRIDPGPLSPPIIEDTEAEIEFEKDREHYVRSVGDALQSIRHGETYQVCLTARARGGFRGDAFDLYRVLRRRNPAPFGAFLTDGHFSVLSSSPERFLQIDAAGFIESRPIKGTIRRSPIPDLDARLSQELLHSEKDRAENVMITDLVRNDLGRIARIGSVRVPSLAVLETYQTVHHLVSTVRAQLREGLSPIDCVRAAFPGGSMTGAPKIRTMEILDDLECSARGVYSGALGYISNDGTTDLSIVIRTIVVADDSVIIGSGGGIVASSDPRAEYEEALLKADAVIAAVHEYHQRTGLG